MYLNYLFIATVLASLISGAPIAVTPGLFKYDVVEGGAGGSGGSAKGVAFAKPPSPANSIT